MKYYKILNEEENHYGLQYKTGLNIDPIPFAKEGSCCEGGIYFTNVENIFTFSHYGPWVREVTIPEDAEMVQDPSKNIVKFRANKVILGEREKLLDISMLEQLVNEGANVQANNNFPLRFFSERGYLEVVKFLVENGADVQAGDNYAVRWAANNGRLEVVKFLVGCGADIQACDNFSLLAASQNGHFEVVKILVKKGADVQVNNSCALQEAAYNGHLELVKSLVENGADIRANNNKAVQWASRNGHLEVVKFLESQIN